MEIIDILFQNLFYLALNETLTLDMNGTNLYEPNISYINPLVQSVRIGATDEYPYVFPCFVDYPQRCAKVGSDLEFIYSVLNGMLQLKISWVIRQSFEELHAALRANEIDLIGNTRILDYDSIKNTTVLHTPPAYYLGIGFFVKSSVEITTLNPLSRFTIEFFVTITLCTLFLHFIKKPKILERYIVTATSLQVLFLLWCFVLNLVAELYGNILTADLITSNKYKTAFKDLVDLGEKLISKECRFAIYDKYVDAPDFQIIFNPTHNKVWSNNYKRAYTTNPPLLFTDKTALFDLVSNHTCLVGIDFVSYDLSFFDSLCDIEVLIFPDDIPFMPYVYYHNIVDHVAGIADVFATDSFRAMPDVLVRYYNELFPKICEGADDKYFLTISKLYACFAVLGAGLVGSSVIYVLSLTKVLDKIVKKFPIFS